MLKLLQEMINLKSYKKNLIFYLYLKDKQVKTSKNLIIYKLHHSFLLLSVNKIIFIFNNINWFCYLFFDIICFI